MRLTTLDGQEPIDSAVGTFTMEDDEGTDYRFARAKCGTCDGHVIDDYRGRNLAPCPACKGEPLNEWKCDDWPSITFAMPEV